MQGMPYPIFDRECRARPRFSVLREKVIDEDGNILELVIWRVPMTPRSPSGVRYRLAFVRRNEEKPAVLYDNHPGVFGQERQSLGHRIAR